MESVFMSKLLINVPNEERINGRTPDSIKYNKDCDDFVCLDDGTITRECGYCNLSLVCQQIDILPNGKRINMESHYVPVIDSETGEILEWQLYCTGMHHNPEMPVTERPDKVR
jgi:hypothetical protein